jgi:hypothetical protein
MPAIKRANRLRQHQEPEKDPPALAIPARLTPAVIGLMPKFFGLPIALSLLSLVAVLSLITAVCGPSAIHSYALSRIKF